MAFLRWPAIDVDEVLDYVSHWNKVLAKESDTIATSTWEPHADTVGTITIDSDSISGTNTTVVVSSAIGNVGDEILLTNRIITNGDSGVVRTHDQTFKFKIKDK